MIGVFDSGSGGLTVLKELRKRTPNADIVYFGDLKNAPYGNKSREELGALTVLGIQKLIESGATEIISACNSVSVSITDPLLEIANFSKENIIEMVGPTVQSFKDGNAKVLIIATKATIKSGIYQNEFVSLGLGADGVSISNLVSLIESDSKVSEMEELIYLTLKEYAKKEYTHAILACTHFPLIESIFLSVIKELKMTLDIFDPAKVVTEEVIKKFDVTGAGETHFILSKDSDVFRKFVSDLGYVNATYDILK